MNLPKANNNNMEEVVQEQPKKIEVLYTKAKISKRLFAYFLDLGLFLLTTFILFSIINIPVTKSSWFVRNQTELVQLRNDTGLYVDNVIIYTYLTNEKELTDKQRKDEMSSRIDAFYHNATYISDFDKMNEQYTARKLKAKSGGVNLFIVDPEDESKVIENPVVVYEKLFDFYKNEVDNYSLAFMIKNTNYFYHVRFSFWTTLIEFIIIMLLSFTFYFLIVPLCICRRGRQTLGMKMEKVGLISIRADNISAGKFVARFFFNLGVFIILDFIAFLIPALVSMTMMILSKTNQNLTNYVFNDYAVDVTNQRIYLNAAEREEMNFKLQEISIENKDLRLK